MQCLEFSYVVQDLVNSARQLGMCWLLVTWLAPCVLYYRWSACTRILYRPAVQQGVVFRRSD